MKSFLILGMRLLLLSSLARVSSSFTAAPSASYLSSQHRIHHISRAMSSSSDNEIVPSETIGLVVEAEIVPERMDDFLEMIQKNAEGSRAEAGNLRFDVIKSQDNPNKFYFYELWKNGEAVASHKKEPHFALWSEFKASGGTKSSVTNKANGVFIGN